MKEKKLSLHNFCIISASAALLCFALICTAVRVFSCNTGDSFNTLAAQSIMPDGGKKYTPKKVTSPAAAEKKSKKNVNEKIIINSPHPDDETSVTDADKEISGFESSTASEEEIAEYDREHEGEQQYPVLEFTSVQGDIAYAGVQVKNSASTDIDIKEELSARLGFSLADVSSPQVLIYHTHTTESFLTYDTGYYYESFYPRSKDKSKNVCAIGEEIVRQLNNDGITAIHDTTIHDDPSYTGAYYRSADTVKEYLEKYPSIKVVIDIHRDGIGTESGRSKPVCSIDGKKAAQFMIMSGYNCDDDPAFSKWEYNLRFALKLQKTAVDMYPDLARPLYFGDFVYNMDINTGSLLIEVGADSNTIEEVRYTGALLGKILSKTLKNEKGS